MKDKQVDILEAATKLFSRYGYHAVGVDRIIADSGVAKMTFYKYFPSKENLIESVLERRDKHIRDTINIGVAKRRTPNTKIKAIFEWYENWFETKDFYGCMFIKASEESPDIASKIMAISKGHKLWLKDLISHLLEDCSIKSHEQMAIHVLAILDGLTVRENLFKEGVKNEMKFAWRYVEETINRKID